MWSTSIATAARVLLLHILTVHSHLQVRGPQNMSSVLRHTLPVFTLSLKFTLYSSPQMFQKPRSHNQILGTRRVLWSKFHTKDAQFYSDLCTSVLPGAPLSACALIHIFGGEVKECNKVLKMLGATVRNLASRATGCSRFVQPWCCML
jgi:hypothetical protein